MLIQIKSVEMSFWLWIHLNGNMFYFIFIPSFQFLITLDKFLKASNLDVCTKFSLAR